MEYTFRTATEADATRIWEIIQQAKAQMYREKRHQWSDAYPSREHIAADIVTRSAYVLDHQGHVIAYAAVFFDEESVYKAIEGKWLSDQPYVVVHRLAVADEMKQHGIATVLMQEVERLAIGKLVHSIKVDTNFDNIGMQRVLAKCGFSYCGEIFYAGNSRQAYEKLI